MRSARLLFYREALPAPAAVEPQEVNVAIVRHNPALDAIVPPNPKLYKLAEGLEFVEGRLWLPDGRLLFSDPNANRIYQYDPRGTGTLSVYRERLPAHFAWGDEDGRTLYMTARSAFYRMRFGVPGVRP